MRLPIKSAFVLVALGAHIPAQAQTSQPMARAAAQSAAQALPSQPALAPAVAPSPVQAQPAKPASDGIHAPKTKSSPPPAPPPPPSPTPAVGLNSGKSTNFSGSLNGFRFVNDFKNDFIPVADVHTSGLCGGMVYTALDYFNAHVPIPTQDYRPADKTALHSYIYERQTHSLADNADKWAEVMFNPNGARNAELFNWGLQMTNGGRLQELIQSIDAGISIPLGLKSEKGQDHQVLAVGYFLGRYKGDPNSFADEIRIKVYDPNFPGQMKTLMPVPSQKIYTYVEDQKETWRTYFVDKKYKPHTPPNIPNPTYPADGKFYELLLGFTTGGDDLRGGNDNVNFIVNLFDGTQQSYANVNLGARWIKDYLEYADVRLSSPINPAMIKNVVVSTTFSGGPGGDNWNMNGLMIRGYGGGFSRDVKAAGFKRFTGDDKSLTIPVNASPPTAPGQINKLILTIATGDDDLRGGNDNLNVIVNYKNGKTQLVENVNNAKRWADRTNNAIGIDLNLVCYPNELGSITIQTVSGGGTGGDNWNMNSVQVRATGNGVDKITGNGGFKRFTGSDNRMFVPLSG
jgi:hypothetical protein